MTDIILTATATSVVWWFILNLKLKPLQKEAERHRESSFDYYQRWLDVSSEKRGLEKKISQLVHNTPSCAACAEGFWCGSVSHPHTCGQPNPVVEIKEIPVAKCSRCGYEGHEANECEHPFPQGHKNRVQRDTDWSRLANQVVGGEIK